MQIPVITSEKCERLRGKEWGYIDTPVDQLPEWVILIPENERLRFLATGSDFEKMVPVDKVISSEKLVGLAPPRRELPRSLESASEDFYLLVGDPELQNVLLTDGPYHEHEQWIETLQYERPDINIFLVPKHPEQDVHIHPI